MITCNIYGIFFLSFIVTLFKSTGGFRLKKKKDCLICKTDQERSNLTTSRSQEEVLADPELAKKAKTKKHSDNLVQINVHA